MSNYVRILMRYEIQNWEYPFILYDGCAINCKEYKLKI